MEIITLLTQLPTSWNFSHFLHATKPKLYYLLVKRTHLYLHWVPTLWLYFLSNSLQIAAEVHSKSPVSLSDWIISAFLSALNSCGEYSYGSFTTWSALIPSYPSLKCDALNNSQHVFISFGKRWKVNSVRFRTISSLKFYLNDMSKLKFRKKYCQGSTILILTSELFIDQTRSKWNKGRKENLLLLVCIQKY